MFITEPFHGCHGVWTDKRQLRPSKTGPGRRFAVILGRGRARISCTSRHSPIFCRFRGGALDGTSSDSTAEFVHREDMGAPPRRGEFLPNGRLTAWADATKPGGARSKSQPKQGR